MPFGLLGSSATLGIGLSVYLDDQFSQASSNISNTLKLMGKDLDDFSQGMARISSIGDGLARFGDKVLAFGTKASDQFATFEHSINVTRVVAGISKADKGYKQLGDTAEHLAEIYGQLPVAIGNAEVELAKSGKSVTDINKMTEAVVALGAATQEPVDGSNGTAAMLVNIMQMYNAGSEEAIHYADILTSAANQSTISVRDLFESLKMAGGTATQLHIPFQETATSFATLGNAGIRGTQAGTAYAQMLRFLETGIGVFATKKEQTALGLLGLSKKDFIDANGHLISMTKLLGLLKERTASFDDTDKLGVLGGIFGIRGDKAMLSLLQGQAPDSTGKLMSSFDAMAEKINSDTHKDITRTTAQQMMDDAAGRAAKLSVAWNRFYIAIGRDISTTLKPVTDFAIKILNYLTEFVQGPVGSWLVKWALILGTSMGPIGRMMSMGARFMGYIVSSSGKLTNAFQMARVASTYVREQLELGAASIVMAAKAMGATQFASKFQDLGGGKFRDPVTGRFVGKGAVVEEAENFASNPKNLGWIERFIMPLIVGSEWIMKTVGVFRVLGSVLGKVLGWLFGWEGMLLDLGVTLLTGKSMFEWLWDGFRSLFGWIFGWPEKSNKSEAPAKIQMEREKTFDLGYKQTVKYSDRLSKEQINSDINKVVHLNIYVDGQKTTEKRINLNDERALASHSIIQ